MSLVPPEIDPVRKGLIRVGFAEGSLRPNVPVPGAVNKFADLLAFSASPFDSRTATVAAVRGNVFSDPEISSLRPLGAPLVFQCFTDHYLLWKQGAAQPRFHVRLTPQQLPRFFESERKSLVPDAIYRAKVWGRLNASYQLDFVDVGLLPLIEEDAGQKLTQLVARALETAKRSLGWKTFTPNQGRWVLKAVFWLLAAKILQDKTVSGFVRLDLTDVEQVFSRLAKHYDSASPKPVPVDGKARRRALVLAAETIGQFGHCGCVSTEALAYLYESVLIDRATRQKLGTHSTPTWLVDYIVGRLRPWIEGIPVADRRVFEPACGHAAFLISAMRLLSELLPAGWGEPRKTYLRKRLHGVEIDTFALEIARLSLTLADVPNPNGWALSEGDMFKSGCIELAVRDATIVLGNPPFERFQTGDRSGGLLPNKATEVFRRVVSNLRHGSVFGFVLPQTFLHSKQAGAVRESLLDTFEIREITLFADTVFRYGEPESVVIIGRKNHIRTNTITYQRVREGQVERFRSTYEGGSVIGVDQTSLRQRGRQSLLVPDLVDVWESLKNLPRFEDYSEIGQGFAHKGTHKLPKGTVTESTERRAGFAAGFSTWQKNQTTHTLPTLVWLNLKHEAIGCARVGTTTGKRQVLLNYGRISRETWRLIGLLDNGGHAIKSRFIAVRPLDPSISLIALWAICNSPVANAWAYCISAKRDVHAGHIRSMPVPNLLKVDLSPLEKMASEYFLAATASSNVRVRSRKGTSIKRARFTQPKLFPTEPEHDQSTLDVLKLKSLHWRMDSEVLRLYGLPSSLERRLLDLFTGIHRRGVPFEQTEYFPKDFTALDRLVDLLAITCDWPMTNQRRAKLMELKEAGNLTPAQTSELDALQRLADARVDYFKPVQMEGADELIEDLKRRGLWKD